MNSSPRRLASRLVERPWGGEVWYTDDPELPLLVKFIYTHERLSVQVHPPDGYAAQHHQCRGKTEMWHIVSAAPGARLALGFCESVPRDRLRPAAESGEIEKLLNWVEPRPGDTFLTPAGTVHAIGAGLELWEVQQQSDITYRFYDYNRGRELHLDHAINITSTERFDPSPVSLPIRSHCFETHLVSVPDALECRPDMDHLYLLVCMEGSGRIAGQPFSAHDTWLIPQASAPFRIEAAEPARFLKVINLQEP